MQPIILDFEGKSPRIHETAFIAPGAVIIGDVEIGPQASVWYNCVLRGDDNAIRVGARSNVQDGTVIHVDGEAVGGTPCLIGEDALVGHMAMLHGCTIKDKGFVGMKATVLDGAIVEPRGFVAACAMVPGGKVVGSDELWAGVPAKKMRELKEGEQLAVEFGAAHYVKEAERHMSAVVDHKK
ncbi:MAG: gamma carbonic anhydrase family protein [Pseudomonadota bacterium]